MKLSIVCLASLLPPTVRARERSVLSKTRQCLLLPGYLCAREKSRRLTVGNHTPRRYLTDFVFAITRARLV